MSNKINKLSNKEQTDKKQNKGTNKHSRNKYYNNKTTSVNDCKDNIPDRNDYTFYAADEQIAKDAASVPFNYIGGSRIPLSYNVSYFSGTNGSNATVNHTDLKANDAILSTSVIKYVPSIGITENINEGVNMAFRQLYAYVRKANSGARNYEVADLGMYVLAMEEIYREFLECKRIIGLSDRFHFYNHNIPYVFAIAENVVYDDLVANAADYRRELNILAKKINSFAIPKYFNSFKRRAFISSYVFGDSTSPRAQFYIFKTTGYYKWSTTTSEQGTELVYVHKDYDQPQTMRDRLNILNGMIDAIMQDEDATIISGDLLKAFPESELYMLANTDENYFTEIMYDEDLLNQIQNAKFVCKDETQIDKFDSLGLQNNAGTANTSRDDVFQFNITQEGQLIKFKPKFSSTTPDGMPSAYMSINMNGLAFNSHKDNPDYKDVLEWSRLMTVSEDVSEIWVESDTSFGSKITKQIISCGLEIPMYMDTIRAHYDSNNDMDYSVTHFTQELYTIQSLDSDNALKMINQMALIMQMDWHPIIYNMSGYRQDDSKLFLGFDSKVTTFIDNEVLNRINTTAIYGAYFAKQLFNKV